MKRLPGDERGLTLVEVIVGAMVFVVGIGAIFSAFVGAGKGSETAQRQDVAAAIATQELERMRSYPYTSLALSAAPASLPDGRLVNSGTQFQATSGATEDLVAPSAGSALAPTSTVAASSGQPGYTIYRVISWADQSCPLASLGLSSLSSTLASLTGASATVQATLNGLNGSVSGTTSLTAATGALGSLLGGLLGGLLSSAVTSLRADLNTSIGAVSATTGLQSALAPIAGDLSALQSAGLTDATGHLKVAALDLCHLPRLSSLLTLPNLSTMAAVTTALTGSGGVQGSLTDLQAQANAAAGFTALTPAGTVTGADASVRSDNSAISASAGASGALSTTKLTSLHKMLGDLRNVLTLSTGTHVMKRISVAVLLGSTRTGVGATRAVWMSSMMSDPQDGLL